MLVRAARHRQAPGDQRRDVAGPAGLHRQPAEVDVGALPAHFLARRRRSQLRRHVQHLHEHRPRVPPRVDQPLRRLGLLQEREQPTDLAQALGPVRGVGAHRAGDALRRAEEIAEHGDGPARRRDEVALRPLEQQRRPAGLEHAIAELRHFQPRIDFGGDALQLADGLELRDENRGGRGISSAGLDEGGGERDQAGSGIRLEAGSRTESRRGRDRTMLAKAAPPRAVGARTGRRCARRP